MPLHPRTALLTFALPLAGCATGARRPPLAPGPAAECVVAAGSASDTSAPAAAPVTVAVTTPLDSVHAPWPQSAGEHLLFAQLYEPLVHLDCTGSIVPALAQSWQLTTGDSPSSDGTPSASAARVTFTLRHEARFTNGAPVRATDVISSWRASADAHAHEPIAPLISAIASAARVIDDSTLLVELPDSLANLRALASPYLAVSRQEPSRSRWPYGTTWYHIDSAPAHFGPGVPESRPTIATIVLRPDSGAKQSGAPTPADTAPLLFRVEPDVDSRDILDRGADLLITSSPTAIQYARTQGSHAAVALPWARRYVLVLPAREADSVEAVEAGTGCVDDDLLPLRDALALTVHAEARPAEGPCWWVTGDGARSARARPHPASRRILYQLHDSTARELAERIVALAAPARNEPAADALREAAPQLFEQRSWSASGTDSVHFTESLARARDGGYILALPSHPAWPAAARASLLAALPWLASSSGGTRALIPLVDTRETLLIRVVRGIPPVTIQHDGTVIFDPAARTRVQNASGRSAP